MAAIGFFYFGGLYGIVPAIVVSYVAFALFYWHFEHKIGFPKVETYAKEEFFNQSKPILKLGIVLMLSAIAGTSFAFALNLVINRLGSTEEVGLYQSAASIVTQGMSITNVVLASDFFSRLSAVHMDTFRMQNLIRQQVDISGKKGNYKETDFRDAGDVYGRSKALGEIVNDKDLTIRTSIVKFGKKKKLR